jgi:hypothetical protein
LDDEPDADDADEEDADVDDGVDAEDEEADSAEDLGALDSWVLDLASEEAVLAAGFSASIAFFLDSDG